MECYRYASEEDQDWGEHREPDDSCTGRGIKMMQWLATRPEKEIAVVTHSSWLKHLFRAFGQTVHEKDKKRLHRLAGNAEVRSICLALHKGAYIYIYICTKMISNIFIIGAHIATFRVLPRREMGWRCFYSQPRFFP
mmetsp:Transcript_27322/g.33353  ORF Transcript_27322/g.33353 Transcript_27322/m.33353 type:complete len:137 (+) Transcript_27322:161-571(+)